MLAKKTAFLKEVSLFANLNQEDLKTVANDFHPKEYQKNETILRQGDPSHELYIVMKGKVRICKVNPAGNETSINILSTHQIIGEFAVIDGQPRSASAKAIGPCVLLAVTRDKFLAHMQNIPGLALAMCQLVTGKARWTTKYAETIAQYDTADRLLNVLLHYNEQLGQEVEVGKQYELDLGLNQTDLASLVGARRGWVNRILGDWRARGLIEYQAGNITILDLPKIEQERTSRMQTNYIW
jgi:CRP/FNR family transcriptional regulator/CRP/FNR family cyclic AMP-dependent transcriptional regulator